MCGVAGVALGDTRASTAAIELCESLYYLQHRGQDAAGIVVCNGSRVHECKANGMAQKVFSHFPDGKSLIQNLPGWCGIAHLRYPTAGTSSSSEAQPFFINSPYGIAMAVNGNLINTEYLSEFLSTEAHRHTNTDSDSELLLNIFAHGLEVLGKHRFNPETLLDALSEVYEKCLGAFACTAMIAGHGILGFRDANGIRPLCLGSRPSQTLEGSTDYFLASESVALQQLGFLETVDIEPGMAVFIDKSGKVYFRQVVAQRSYTPDIFEFVYFARQDSVIDGISVHHSRQKMGIALAKKLIKALGENGVNSMNAVIPVPETSTTAAASLARALGIELCSGFVKNRYVFRTFILPNQDERRKGVRRKLTAITSEFKNKNIIIVDDSIVRGTTSREIINMAKEAGARKVVFVSCSPPLRHPHVYGIDIADPSELIAHGRSVTEIAKHLGADALVYQDLSDLTEACLQARVGDCKVQAFEDAIFTGKYATQLPKGYLEHLSRVRGKAKKEVTLPQQGFGSLNSTHFKAQHKNLAAFATGANQVLNTFLKPDYCEDHSSHNLAIIEAS